MIYIKYFIFVILHLAFLSDAVKVNMQGSLMLGKEVMETITQYINRSVMRASGRRFMTNDKDVIEEAVQSADVCRNLQFCDKQLANVLNEYIIALAKSVEIVFNSILNPEGTLEVKTFLFEKQLNHILKDIQKILKKSDANVTDDKAFYTWINIIKQICSKFQMAALSFVSDHLEGDSKEINEAKKILSQKLIIAIIKVEKKYINKFCIELNICLNSNECTKALNTLLSKLKTADSSKVKDFVNIFSNALSSTPFYSYLGDAMANKFKNVLNDMAYSDKVSAKDILASIQRVLEDKLNTDVEAIDKSEDLELVNVILSDFEHVYSIKKKPFRVFMDHFLNWMTVDRRLDTHLRFVLKEIKEQLSSASEEISLKIINEVKVFLEITLDPE